MSAASPLPFRLLERFLPSSTADAVIGDLIERQRDRRAPVARNARRRSGTFATAHPTQVELMSSFLSDLRLAARLLVRAPTFTVAAVLTLGVAIGATAAIFSVANPVLIQPLPYRNPDRVMVVWEQDRDGSRSTVGFTTIRDYIDRATTFESAAALGDWQPTLSEGNEPERLQGLRVSSTYFRTLGVQPAFGRDFRADEDVSGAPRVVIISHALWQRRFGGDPSIIGKPISIGGTPMPVVGVMPEGFDDVTAPGAQIWRVLGYAVTDPYACRTCRHLRMIARLTPGVTIERAQSELTKIHKAIVAEHPEDYGSPDALVAPLQREVTLHVSAGAVRARRRGGAHARSSRSRTWRTCSSRDSSGAKEEFAIRTALGASSPRLTRQLLTEALLIGVLGGIAGLAVAWVAIPALVRQLPPQLASAGRDSSRPGGARRDRRGRRRARRWSWGSCHVVDDASRTWPTACAPVVA